MDTIFALATARGRAGVAIIRLSGPEAHQVVSTLTGRDLPDLRRAVLRQISANNEVLDEALILLFGPGESFTGEAVAELHIHGSVAVSSAILRVLSNMPGLRLAEPGEFTRRALENGRLDLAQVEGLADLIDAETEAQRKQAMRALSGHIGQKVDAWRNKLLRAAALMEAVIDFAEEDVPVDVRPEVRQILRMLQAEMQQEIAGSAVAERIRQGFEVAIIGAPNVGKSTLLNAIAGRDAAITSHIAGTTRDVIEVRMELAGLPVTLLDTAGIRETTDIVEGIGIDRAKSRALSADLRIFLVADEKETLPFSAEPDDLVVIAKADLQVSVSGPAVSGTTGAGVSELIDKITQVLELRSSQGSTIIRERQRIALVKASGDLNESLDLLASEDAYEEVIAELIRRATRFLDTLIGKIGVEDVLGEIFSSFCIGK